MRNLFFILAGVLLIKVFLLFGVFTKESGFFYFAFYLFLYFAYLYFIKNMQKLEEVIKQNWKAKEKDRKEEQFFDVKFKTLLEIAKFFILKNYDILLIPLI